VASGGELEVELERHSGFLSGVPPTPFLCKIFITWELGSDHLFQSGLKAEAPAGR
jgi:hypothetical protein